MSQTQKLNFRLFKSLMLQLRQYGLNPRDWRVCRVTSNALGELALVHRHDQDFMFKGSVRQSGQTLQWENLFLASL